MSEQRYYNEASHDFEASWNDDTSTLTLTAKVEGSGKSALSTDISSISGDLSDGTNPSGPTKTVNAGSLNLVNIASFADGKAGIANGKVTIVKNTDDNKLLLKIGDIVIGTSTSEVGGAGDITFTSDGTAGGTALGSITLTGSVAGSDFSDPVDTGLTYAVGGGDDDGDSEEKELVKSADLFGASVAGAIATANPANDTISSVGIDDTALGQLTTVKIGGDVEVNLADAVKNLSDTDKLEDLLSAIEDAAKAAIKDWNDKNSEDKGYSYEYKGLSTDGTEAGLVTFTASGLSILAYKVQNDDDPPELGSGEYTITMQIGDDASDQMEIKIGAVNAEALGISSLNIKTADDANSSIEDIKDAINKVSSIRGKLGAYQNRLEHTANNLSVMTENIQDAESTIRDTDVAEEMMSYVKNNILVQSAQAMLAQANQVPQGVLQLLG